MIQDSRQTKQPAGKHCSNIEDIGVAHNVLVSHAVNELLGLCRRGGRMCLHVDQWDQLFHWISKHTFLMSKSARLPKGFPKQFKKQGPAV